MNTLSRGYQIFDDVIMKGAETALQTYNWTTGDTKSGLANKMLTVAPILETAGYYALVGVATLTSIMAGLTFVGSYMQQRENEKQETTENKALENGAIDIKVDAEKNWGGKIGHTLSVAGALMYVSGDKNVSERPMSYLLPTGLIIRGLSYQIMRCDSIPPRKNCVSRGFDKLSKIVSEYKTQKALIPQLAR